MLTPFLYLNAGMWSIKEILCVPSRPEHNLWAQEHIADLRFLDVANECFSFVYRDIRIPNESCQFVDDVAG